MESYSLIKYKWQHGIYNLKKMIELVQTYELNEEQFFDITRYNYDIIKKSDKLNIKIVETDENL